MSRPEGGRLGGLLGLRTSIVLAMTGGPDELQSWAVDLLGQFGDDQEYGQGMDDIPRQYWSRQVRWLRPTSVGITPMFKAGQNAVFLDYYIPHEGLGIVVGPPGAAPPDDPDDSWRWRRFGDGLYYWTT